MARVAVFQAFGYTAFAAWMSIAASAFAQPAEILLTDRDREIRARYLQLLDKDPYQERAFERAYASFQENEGVAAWIEDLEEEPVRLSNRVILGRILARRLATADAIRHLERAGELGGEDPRLNALLGHVYADAGRYADAVPLLDSAAVLLTDPEQRADAIRRLGDAHNRLGNRDRAIEAWQQLAEGAHGDAFARWELAAIYEDHRLWNEAAAAYADIADRAQADPYARCRALRAQAISNMRMDDVSGAIALFEEAMALASPGNWLFNDLTQHLIAAHESLGDLDGLARYIQVRLEDDPASVEYRTLLADVYTRQQDVERAETEYRALLERAPDHVPAYLALAKLLEDNERIDDAGTVLHALAERFPRDTAFIRRLGELYWNAGDEAKAVESWRRVLDERRSPERRALLANWLAAHERIEDAITELAIAVDAKDDRAWQFDLAALYVLNGNADAARATWNATLSESSTAAELTEVARLFEANGFVEDAEALYDRALGIDPALHDARHALAALLSRIERVEDALPHFEMLAAVEDSEHWRSRGERGMLRSFNALGITAQKQREWEQAVQEQPDSIERKLRLARLYQSRGHHLGAVELYQACAALEPEAFAHREALADAYQRAGRYAKAAETYEALIDDQPSRARAYLRDLVGIYGRINDREATERAAERVVQLAPTDPDARVLLAQVYLRHGRDDDAFQHFRDAIRLDPSQSSFHLQYAEVLVERQRHAEARDVYRRLFDETEDRGVRRECLRRLASTHAQLNSLDALTREFQSHIRATPNRLDAYADLAAIYAGAEKPVEALATLERAHARLTNSDELLQLLLNAAHDANDLQKTIAYTEERIALSGNPSPHELVRLGRAHAETGDMDAALATWARIREECPDDAVAMAAEANALFAHGYIDEAFERTRAALEADPTDTGLRAEFAQQLAEQGELDQAFDQFFIVLEYAEPEPATAAFNRKPTYINRRERTVRTMVGLAQAFGRSNTVLDRFERARNENAQSQTARNDLMFAYESLQRLDDAIELAEESLEVVPDDTALMQRLANLYNRSRRNGDAAEIYLRLAELEPSREKEIRLRAAMLFQHSEEQRERGLEILESLHESDPQDVRVALQLASLHASLKNYDEAERLYTEMRDPESAYWREESEINFEQARNHVDQNWAAYLESNAREDEARKVYEYVLVRPDAWTGGPPQVYRVTGHGSSIGILSDLRNAVQRLFPSVGHTRANIAHKYQALAPDLDRNLSELIDGLPDSGAIDIRRALQKMQVAGRISNGDDESAARMIESLLGNDAQDLELYNALLYVHERQFDFQRALDVYDRIKIAAPHAAGMVEQAVVQLAIQEGDFERAARILRAQLDKGAAHANIASQIQQIYQLGGKEIAISLVENVVAQRNPPLEALMLASRIHYEQGDYDTATEFAERAWESAGGLNGPSGQQTFSMLYSLYSHSGRGETFVARLRQAADEHPHSIALRKQTAEIYKLTGERKEAIEQFEAIHAMRPRDVQTMRSLAELYINDNREDDAIEMYNALLAAQPSMYGQVSRRLAQLYERSGRINEWVEMEERLVQRGNNARDILTFAHAALARKDKERAIAYYERALALEPDNTHIQWEIANGYAATGDHERARDAVDALLASARGDRGVQLQFHQYLTVASIYDRSDALPELEAVSESFGEIENNAPARLLLLAAIAHNEARHEHAFNLLAKGITKSVDHRFVQAMFDIAQAAENPDWAIEALEKAAEADVHGNYWERIAEVHLARNDRERAVQARKSSLNQKVQPHAYAEVLRWMIRHDLHEQAEAFYDEYARVLRLPQNAQRVDREIVQAYVNSGAFEDLVANDIIRPDNPNLPTLLQTLSGARHESGQRALTLFETLSSRFQDNADFLRSRARLHAQSKEQAEALPLWAHIVELNPDNVNDRQQYARALQSANRRDEASAMLMSWTSDKPSLIRLRMAVRYVDPRKDPDAYRAWREGVLAELATDDHEAARELLAPLDEQIKRETEKPHS